MTVALDWAGRDMGVSWIGYLLYIENNGTTLLTLVLLSLLELYDKEIEYPHRL